MRVLITGASGYLGGRLIQYLLEQGNVKIRAVSRQLRSWPAGVDGQVADTGDPDTLRNACKGVDALINLAAMAERACAADPAAALRVNAGGTLAWVSAARCAAVPRFVQVSTAKVYGANLSGTVSEETACRPQSHYAITHRVAEDYADSQHPNSVVFRLANGYGAPVDAAVDCWEIIVNDFCRQAAVERRITIKSSGLAWRNFVAVGDVTRALDFAVRDLPSGTYNLGSPQSLPLRDVARDVAQVCERTLGFSPPVTWGPAAPDENHGRLDYRSDRLAKAGFEAHSSFADEVSQTLLVARAAFG